MDKSEIIYNVERAIMQDQAAIEALYHYTYAAAYAFTYHLCHNHNDVEDILQESYIAAFDSLSNIKDKAKFWHWLRGIILNKWRDYCREIASSYQISIYESAANDEMEYWQLQASVQNLVEDQELSRVIRETVQQLPENQRICAVLYYYKNMNMEQIADKLHIPLGSVKSRLHYARKKIEKVLKKENLLAVGGAAASSVTPKDGTAANILAKILAALEEHLKSQTPAARTVSGLTVKLGAGLISAAAVGITGAAIVLPHMNRPTPPPEITIVSPSSVTAATAVPTTVTTTAATETTTAATTTEPETTVPTTTVTAPMPFVSFEYQATGGGIRITKYTGSESDVSVPTTLDGYRVVAIGDKAFAYCHFLHSVTIPDSVTSIGIDAFRECDNLASVSFGGGVEEIGDMAFVGCDSLYAVHLPPSVRSVGIYAFAYCSSLHSVIISQGTNTIRYNAFYDCPNLCRLTLPPSVSKIGADVLAGASGDLVLYVSEGSYAHDYAMENSFTYSFY